MVDPKEGVFREVLGRRHLPRERQDLSLHLWKCYQGLWARKMLHYFTISFLIIYYFTFCWFPFIHILSFKTCISGLTHNVRLNSGSGSSVARRRLSNEILSCTRWFQANMTAIWKVVTSKSNLPILLQKVTCRGCHT